MTWVTLIALIALTNTCHSRSVKQRKTDGPKRECPYPVSKEHLNGTEIAINSVIDLHRAVSEVRFNGAFGKSGTLRHCQLKCINGEWVGPLCLQEGETSGKFQPVYKDCSSHIFQTKFVLTYQNKIVLEDREFPHSAVVKVHCREFGLYKLIGDSHLSCHNSAWKTRIPSCVPTSSISNFTESVPPTVLAKVTSGSASVEPSGELAVYPGSTVHLECLFLRSAGTPEWSWTSTYRTYPTGWAINSEERDFNFRLSVFYIKPPDTGIYTCSTPKGLTHSVVLNVIAVHCDASKVITTDPNLLTHMEGSRLGQRVTFQCREGFKLNGTANITCQASGLWSSYPPRCIPVVCPSLDLTGTNVRLVKQNVAYGGTTVFECPFGHRTIGVTNILCQGDGYWSGQIPTCKEITCPAPLVPPNGKLEYSNESAVFPYKVSSVLTFSCKGVYQLIGEDTIVCQESGFWSNPPPFCKTKCPHPGDPDNGRVTPAKQDYDVGERISVSCKPSYEASSKSKGRCQKNGLWTEVGLECIYRPGRQTRPTTTVGPSSETQSVPVTETVTGSVTDTETEPVTTATPIATSTMRLGKNDTEAQIKYNGTDVFYLVDE